MSDLASLLRGYLLAVGWRELEPGRWLMPGQSKGRRNVTACSLSVAIQNQIESELYASGREERIRCGLEEVKS